MRNWLIHATIVVTMVFAALFAFSCRGRENGDDMGAADQSSNGLASDNESARAAVVEELKGIVIVLMEEAEFPAFK